MRRSNRLLQHGIISVLFAAMLGWGAPAAHAQEGTAAPADAAAANAAGATASAVSSNAGPQLPLASNIDPLPEGEAIIALVVNTTRFGDVEARIDFDNPFLHRDIVRTALSPALSPAQIERIFSGILPNLEWVGIADLAVAGVTGEWNMETLTYTIVTPGEYTSRREVDFSPEAVVQENLWIPPSAISGVVNVNVSGAANFSVSGTSLPLSANADALLKLWSLAIESSGSATYINSKLSLSFNSMRGVLDFPAIEGRLLAGMVSSVGTGGQSRSEIYGFSLQSLEDFSRYDRNYSPSLAFTLQKPSTVRFNINGTPIRTLKLDMGNYRVYDVPFSYGLNELEVQVEESRDKEGVILYKPVRKYVATETGLLVGGRFEYGISAGVGRVETDQPIVTGFMRYGYRSNLTVGLSAQADLRSAMGGASFVIGTDFGGFILDTEALYAWDGRANPFAFSGSAQYHLARPAHPEAPGIGLSLEYSSEGFTAPQPITAVFDPRAVLRAGASIGGVLAQNANYGLGAQWTRTYLSPADDKFGISASLGASIGKSASINVGAGFDFATGKGPSFSGTISVSASDPEKTGRQIGLSQSGDGSNTVTYSDQTSLLGGMGYGIRLQNITGGVSEPTSVSANTGFSTQYFTFSGAGGATWGGNLAAPNGAINFNLSSALAFAGGSLAISKPLYDSFVIFDPDRTTGSMRVDFAVDAGSKLSTRGGAVASPIPSYRKLRASMNFPEADADITASVPQAGLSSGYRSGFIYRVGLLKRLYVLGRLVDGQGSTVPYVAGEVIAADGSFVDLTFTDDAGMFQIYSLLPGVYRVLWPDSVGVLEFSVPFDVDGQVDLGDQRAMEPTPDANQVN